MATTATDLIDATAPVESPLDGDQTLWALPEEMVAPSRRTIRRWLIGVSAGVVTLIALGLSYLIRWS